MHGQLIPIDAGKTGNLIWTQEELEEKAVDGQHRLKEPMTPGGIDEEQMTPGET